MAPPPATRRGPRSILDLFAADMKKRGYSTMRCRNPECKAVLWLESDHSLEDIVKGNGRMTLMRYAHIPEEECLHCKNRRELVL